MDQPLFTRLTKSSRSAHKKVHGRKIEDATVEVENSPEQAPKQIAFEKIAGRMSAIDSPKGIQVVERKKLKGSKSVGNLKKIVSSERSEKRPVSRQVKKAKTPKKTRAKESVIPVFDVEEEAVKPRKTKKTKISNIVKQTANKVKRMKTFDQAVYKAQADAQVKRLDSWDQYNAKVRSKNKVKKPKSSTHRPPWGSNAIAQNVRIEEKIHKQANEARKKKREWRENVKKTGRSRVGLDYVLQLHGGMPESKRSVSEPRTRIVSIARPTQQLQQPVTTPDQENLHAYMMRKRLEYRTKKSRKLRSSLDEEELKAKRLEALEKDRIERLQRYKEKKKAANPEPEQAYEQFVSIIDDDAEEISRILHKDDEDTVVHVPEKSDRKEQLKAQLDELKERVGKCKQYFAEQKHQRTMQRQEGADLLGISLSRIALRVSFDYFYTTLEWLFNDSLVDEDDSDHDSRIHDRLTIDVKHSPLTTEDLLPQYTVDSNQFLTHDYDSLDESQPFMLELQNYEEKVKRESEIEAILEENLAQAAEQKERVLQETYDAREDYVDTLKAAKKRDQKAIAKITDVLCKNNQAAASEFFKIIEQSYDNISAQIPGSEAKEPSIEPVPDQRLMIPPPSNDTTISNDDDSYVTPLVKTASAISERMDRSSHARALSDELDAEIEKVESLDISKEAGILAAMTMEQEKEEMKELVKESLQCVKTHNAPIKDYIVSLFYTLQHAQIPTILHHVPKRNSVELLCQLQEYDNLNEIDYMDNMPLINVSVFFDLAQKMERLTEHEQILNKMIFDCINEYLDELREIVKPRLPWIPYQDKAQMLSLETIQEKTTQQLKEWNEIQSGTIFPPDSENEVVQETREDKLSTLLQNDVLEMDRKWICYKNEETQVKLDLADLILDSLCVEITDVLATNK